MIFIVLTGLATVGTAWGTVYEGIARRDIPWSYAGCSLFFALLFLASLLVFH
jgi:hypothetical protein